MEIAPTQSVDDPTPPEGAPPEGTPPEGKETPPEGEHKEGMDPNVPANEQSWEADLNYKVRDEQKKMDEGLAGLIDSKEKEDYFRELYTKAEGLDWGKENLSAKNKQFEDLTEKHSTLDTEMSQFRDGMGQLARLKDDDFMAFQRHWNIADKAILERASAILKLDEEGFDAQRENERQFEQRQQGYNNESRIQQESARSQAATQELHQLKMQQAMSAPEIADFRTRYNERLGTGAFEAAVDDYGSLQYHTTQRYVEPSVAAAEVYRRNQALIPSNQPAQEPQGEVNPNEPPVTRIPNLGQGRPGSSVRKRIQTMAELRKFATSLQGTEY